MPADPVELTEDGAVPRRRPRSEPKRAIRVPLSERANESDVEGGDHRRRESAGYGGYHRSAAADGGLGFVETWRAIKRWRWTILAITILGVIVAGLVTLQLTPKYSAKATVMLDPREANVVDVDEVLSGLPADDDTVNSEILVIRSPVIVARIARDLGLVQDPEFNKSLREKSSGLGAYNPLSKDGWERLKRWFGKEAPPSVTEEEALLAEHSDTLDAILENLTVSRVGRSRAIDIRFVSARPETTAKVVNALASAYLVDQVQEKFRATEEAQRYLDDRVQELRQRVREAERRVEDYRLQAGLVGTSAGTVAAQQLSGLNTQLILAQTARAEAEARLRQVQALAGGQGGAESAAEVLSSPLIVNLRGRETEAERKIAELSQEYGERHPRMIAARAEIQDIRVRIREEVAKIVSSIEGEVAVARAREETLQQNVQNLERVAASQGSAEVQMRALEREAEAARAVFQLFLTRSSETEAQTDIQRPDARILSRADVPTTPNFPKPAIILPIAALFSMIIGMAIALLLEQLDRGYRSGETIEADLGLPVFALTPSLPASRRLASTPEKYVVSRPSSSFAEALRSVDTGIRLSNLDRAPRSVMITSSIPKEGKSSLAMSMARLLARGGRRVLLIDGDVRRPRVAKALGVQDGRGLVEVLTDEIAAEDAIQADPETELHVLTSGSRDVASPPDILGSKQMADLLRRMEEKYDLVIVDSAPVLAVSDGRALARHVDATVFVVRWASTRQEVVRMAVKQLQESGARVAGVVLSAVNVRRHAQYSYGDSGYYYGSSRRYYKD